MQLLVLLDSLVGFDLSLLSFRQCLSELGNLVLSFSEMDSGVDLSVACLLSCVFGLS